MYEKAHSVLSSSKEIRIVSSIAVTISSREEYGIHIFNTNLERCCSEEGTIAYADMNPPMIILGRFLGLGQSRLDFWWKEVCFADSIQSYSVLSEQTPGM